MYCRNCGEALNDNQAVCLKCGVEVGKGRSFCPNCGNEVAQEAVVCVRCGVPLKNSAKPRGINTDGIAERELVRSIILSIITCGIYSIIWFIALTNEMNKATGNEDDTNGGLSFLLSLVTCGIYGHYWAYKMGEKRDAMIGEKAFSNILYLVLSLFGFSIVVYALLQDTLNKAIANK